MTAAAYADLLSAVHFYYKMIEIQQKQVMLFYTEDDVLSTWVFKML